ncbi:MAG: type II toxin-antitoxin system prevent-host-death family antitoxin [Acidobacteriota bacterium]|nr:type II toxin-antitoxin system prevent-host-death family antitoxin [Acidobacteriota bacterium]
MQTVNIADLKNNLSAYLKRVRNGEEMLVKDRHRLIARLMPLSGAEEMEAVLEGRPGNIRASSQHCFQGC